jgi:hypothetical protein
MEVPLGLIDTLSSGFKVVQRRPWLVLLPVLLDLWLWLGPRWSIQPLVDSLLRLWTSETLPPELAQTAEPYRELLTAAGASFNLWWLVDNNPTFLRTALPGLAEPARFGAAPGIIEVPGLALLVWAPLLLLLGVALGSVFMAAVTSQLPAPQANETKPATPEPGASAPAQQRPGAAFWLRRAARTFVLATLFGLFILALLLLSSLLLSIVLTPLFLISPQAGAGATSLAALLVGSFGVVAYIMLYFVVAAMVSDGVGLWQAMWRSFNVVYRNFWATLGLLVLLTLILWGFGLIWQRLAAASPLGVLAAIFGNAVLITGLTAARLVFYQERSARWLATLVAQQAAVEPPAKS